MKKNGFIFLIFALLISSCYKEEINIQPKILAYDISEENSDPGDTITISITTQDADGDNISLAWKSKYGQFLTDTTLNTVKWVVPFIEGINYPMVELSDGKVVYDQKIPIECSAFIKDNFSTDFPNKDTSNVLITWQDSACNIKAAAFGSDYKYYELPDVAIDPPYAVYIDVNTVYSIPYFSPSDKYGVYLDFWNTGADTLIKALWFRIYPTSDTKIWTINVLKDIGGGSAWEEIANHSMGTGNTVSKLPGIVNKLKLVVDANNEFSVYNNDELIVTTNVLAQNYYIDGISPGLRLQKTGVRGSNGSITIENILVTSNINLLSGDLFNE